MTATAISTSLTIWPAVDNCQLTAPMFRVPRFPAPCETALNSFKATRQVTDAGTSSLDCPLLYSVILHTVTFCSALLPSGKSPVVLSTHIMATVQSQQDVEAAAQPLLEAHEPSRDWKREFATSAYAWLSHTATCILLGLLSAVALKLFGPPIATAVVLLFVVVLVLAYYGYVNLNWRTVTTAFLWGLDADRDGRVNLNDCKHMCSKVYGVVIGFGLSAVGGFLLGFWMGIKLL